jgi:hypothetical protein
VRKDNLNLPSLCRTARSGRRWCTSYGFAMDSREEVDRRAAMATDDGILLWETFEGPFPVGYICALKDPNGNTVEMSCGHLLESEAR